MEKFNIYNPYDNKSIGLLPYMSYNEISKNLEKSYNFFSNKKKWLTPNERIYILENFLDLLKKNQNSLIRQAIMEGGKPFLDTEKEMQRALNVVSIAIDQIKNMAGREIPMNITSSSLNRLAFTHRFPIGVVFAICAFNHPINLIIHQISASIASNCPILIKPASKTPYSCIKIIDILNQTNIPKNFCHLVICKREVTEKLVKDPRISFLSFIGSEDIGWKLKTMLAPGTTCTLEHGGIAPTLICESANIDNLIPLIIKGGFYHAGQVCISTHKVFIHESLENEICEKLTKSTKKLLIGDPQKKDIGIEVGPLISTKSVERIDNLVKDSLKNGAKLLCGGKILHETFYEPTLLLNPPDNAPISTKEIFGPVICIYTCKNYEEAIKRANSTPYFFHASVFTQDIDKAINSIKNIDATSLMINDSTAFRVDWMPFGGRRRSGLNSSGIIDYINQMTFEKLTVIKYNLNKF